MENKSKGTDILRHVAFLLTSILVLVAGAIQRDGRLLGKTLGKDPVKESVKPAETMVTAGDTVVINTTALGSGVQGYAGTVPLEIYVVDGRVADIKALDNLETPDFFKRAAQLFDNWIGLTTKQALKLKVDAVSGATFTSNAIIANVRLGLGSLAPEESAGADTDSLPLKFFASLLVLVLAMAVPLVWKNRNWRTVQLLLNVAVLGLWCGTFISYTSLLSLISGGPRGWLSLPLLLMIVAAFIYPLFGKKNYYCMQVCPFGSAQELAGKLSKKKLKMSAGVINALTRFRQILWIVLMLLMLAGVWTAWMDYEFFTAFIFQSASVTVIVFAVMSLIFSVFVPRPYCRFVCPTGTLLKFSQNSK